MEEQWDLVISSLQDVYNANEVIPFDDDTNLKSINFGDVPTEKLQTHLKKLRTHEENVRRAQRLLEAVNSNLDNAIEYSTQMDVRSSATPVPVNHKREAASDSQPALEGSAAPQLGKCYWVSEYNPDGPLRVGSEVAYKPRKSGEGEWFQCEVVKISPDGLRFEVRDPEPDEMGNTGKLFKCNWKEIIYIPPEDSARSQIPNYPAGTKVLARYPETTTFYPAIVIGTKRDGVCRLKFDGEEEVDKEMEVARRLVLPFPTVSSLPTRK
ncbi:hypothetical protein HG536_0C02740 [Torulaspora globosa]|uniref:SGF29 C-terminal domain-containing protein n=1 Tax=Torulaspora globosa TaxID=48254 RepID=A0A7G3ZF19_9SACH|nr:uncharacterized protein HG536_0C02740 [Torulaspora globosa]QLL32105.1 hypothetical protein HG536_0C02740 [Torulaspora globosa]